jgi:hypothetical protein
MHNLTEIEQMMMHQGMQGINDYVHAEEYFNTLYFQAQNEEERLKYQTVLNNFQRYYQEMQTNY